MVNPTAGIAQWTVNSNIVYIHTWRVWTLKLTSPPCKLISKAVAREVNLSWIIYAWCHQDCGGLVPLPSAVSIADVYVDRAWHSLASGVSAVIWWYSLWCICSLPLLQPPPSLWLIGMIFFMWTWLEECKQQSLVDAKCSVKSFWCHPLIWHVFYLLLTGSQTCRHDWMYMGTRMTQCWCCCPAWMNCHQRLGTNKWGQGRTNKTCQSASDTKMQFTYISHKEELLWDGRGSNDLGIWHKT